MKNHGERAHSKFSASGSERWINCPGSVALSEGIPDRTSIWAEEGTTAHEVLESILDSEINGRKSRSLNVTGKVTRAMFTFGSHAASFILKKHRELPGSEIMVETRVYLKFIHPEMFGTFDSAVVDHFGTLHVFDYKYGQGHAVSPRNNLQMVFYGIGVAQMFDWNFKEVKLWIIQPRIKGYRQPECWTLTLKELRAYVPLFREAVKRVEENPHQYQTGSWCHWCKAKGRCPLQREKSGTKATAIFQPIPEVEDSLVFTDDNEEDFL